jgi:hypothetical protein
MDEPDHLMLIGLHKNATTTPAIRTAIQNASGSDYELASRFRARPKTSCSGMILPPTP